MSPNIRFGLYVAEPASLEDAVKYGVRAEECGFRFVAFCENLFWWSPSYPPVWDNFIVMTTVVNYTKKIAVFTDVIDPVKRHPVVVAHMLSTLDNLSKGRTVVGVGAGEVANFGPLLDLVKGYPSLSGMKEFITVMRGVWESTAEKPFNFDGKFFHVNEAYLTLKPYSKPHPPIYVGALGANMRKAVAEIADGWIPVTYTCEIYEKDWKDIQDHAKRVGRKVDSIDAGLTVGTIVLKDGEEAKRIATEFGKLRLLGRPQLLSVLGFKDLIDHDLAAAKRQGPLAPMTKRDLWDAVPEELARKVTISGTPDEAIDQIEHFIKAGVRLFALWLPYEHRSATEETVEIYRNTILPYFENNGERF